jgi:hypothetical protein
MTDSPPVTVVETPEFLSAMRKLMDEEERSLLVDHIARNPLAGDLIPGAGGVWRERASVAVHASSIFITA